MKTTLIEQILQVQSGADAQAMSKEELENSDLAVVHQRAASVGNRLVGELHAAAMCGDAAWIERLLESPLINIDANTEADVDDTPKTDASIEHGQDLLVEGLGTGAGAGWTALHQAVDGSQLEAVTCLLRAGADPNSKTKFGSTPLFWAHSPEIARLLLVFGANPNIVDSEHRTPQQWHEHMCRREVAQSIKTLQNPRHVLEEARQCNTCGETWLAHRLCDLGLRFFVVADASAVSQGAASQQVRQELEDLRRATAGDTGLELGDKARLEQRALLAAVDTSIKPDTERVRQLLVSHLRSKNVQVMSPTVDGAASSRQLGLINGKDATGQIMAVDEFDKAFAQAMQDALIWRKPEGSLSDLPQQVDITTEMDRERLLQICREEDLFEVYNEDTVNQGRWVMRREDELGESNSKLPELAFIHKQLDEAILERKAQREQEDLAVTTRQAAGGDGTIHAAERERPTAQATVVPAAAHSSAFETDQRRQQKLDCCHRPPSSATALAAARGGCVRI